MSENDWSAVRVGDEVVEYGRWDSTPFIVRVEKVTPKRFATRSTTYNKADGRVVGAYGQAIRPTPEHREEFARHCATQAFAVAAASATNRHGLDHLSIERIRAITEELTAPRAVPARAEAHAV